MVEPKRKISISQKLLHGLHKSKMFLPVAFACIALAHAQGPYYQAQPYDVGYAIRDLRSQQYRQEVGNGVGGVAGSYGYVDGRGNIQQTNYGVISGLSGPIYGYGNGGYGLGYGGYGVYGNGNVGYGNALGFSALQRGYGDVFYGADLDII